MTDQSKADLPSHVRHLIGSAKTTVEKAESWSRSSTAKGIRSLLDPLDNHIVVTPEIKAARDEVYASADNLNAAAGVSTGNLANNKAIFDKAQAEMRKALEDLEVLVLAAAPAVAPTTPPKPQTPSAV